MTPSAIRTEDLVKRFRAVEALRGLSLDVPLNSIYALVGPNGAGKTTAIKILMNLLQASSGRVEVLGTDSSTLAGEAFASIGYVSENQELPDWMSARELLSHVRPLYPRWDRQLEADLVGRFKLPMDRKLKGLSRGARMQVALASSLAYRPRLIVLDEPFSGLDPVVREELTQSLLELPGEATVFISSHDLAEIETFATHVGYLQSGKLLFSEEMKLLSDRFREVEVVLEQAVPSQGLWPSTWMQVEIAGSRVQFVESGFNEVGTAQRIRATFGEIRGVTYRAMSLKSVFLAVARFHDTDGRQNPS